MFFLLLLLLLSLLSLLLLLLLLIVIWTLGTSRTVEASPNILIAILINDITNYTITIIVRLYLVVLIVSNNHNWYSVHLCWERPEQSKPVQEADPK